MDLGRKVESPESYPTPPANSKKPKITYPGFSLSDKVATQFTDEHEPKLGSEYTATVRLCVTSLTADEYGSRVQFDIKSMDDIAEKGEDADEKESADLEEKTLGYKRKKSDKEAPDLSAKSLED